MENLQNSDSPEKFITDITTKGYIITDGYNGQPNIQYVDNKKAKYNSNPFVVEFNHTSTGGIVDMPNINLSLLPKLSPHGITVLARLNDTCFKNDHSTRLVVKDICDKLYQSYNDANATKIRRGIRNLIANRVLAYSDIKDIYWINKAAIWIR